MYHNYFKLNIEFYYSEICLVKLNLKFYYIKIFLRSRYKQLRISAGKGLWTQYNSWFLFSVLIFLKSIIVTNIDLAVSSSPQPLRRWSKLVPWWFSYSFDVDAISGRIHPPNLIKKDHLRFFHSVRMWFGLLQWV